MRILFMGTPDFAGTCLKKLYSTGYEIVGVFTQPDKPVGRKQKLEKPPVKVLAEEHGTPVFQPVKLRDGTALNIIKDLNPDIILVVAYGRILPDSILEYPKYGCVNIHGSLLPKYRGAAPIQWSVINGDKVTGVTAMYMSHDMDGGDIIAQRSTEILDGETSGELFERLADIGADLLCDVLKDIFEGKASRTPQDTDKVTYAPPLTKEMGVIDWNKPSRLVISHINGMNPWPVASAELAGQRFKIYKAEASKRTGNFVPGSIIAADKEGICVGCLDGAVVITELQAPGGKRMKAADYLRGHPICL